MLRYPAQGSNFFCCRSANHHRNRNPHEKNMRENQIHQPGNLCRTLPRRRRQRHHDIPHEQKYSDAVNRSGNERRPQWPRPSTRQQVKHRRSADRDHEVEEDTERNAGPAELKGLRADGTASDVLKYPRNWNTPIPAREGDSIEAIEDPGEEAGFEDYRRSRIRCRHEQTLIAAGTSRTSVVIGSVPNGMSACKVV